MIRNGHRDRHVDADHPDIHTRSEFACGVAVAREDRNAVAILMLAGQRQRLFKIIRSHDLEDRAEDFFLVTFHRRFDMIEQRRADEEALFMPLKREAATIDDKLSAFINTFLDPAFNACLMRRVDHWAVVRVRVSRHADAECRDCGDQLLTQRNCGFLTHRNNDGKRHTALSCRTECRT